jgi:hypothetical protein
MHAEFLLVNLKLSVASVVIRGVEHTWIYGRDRHNICLFFS